jgi:hypothetical protein
LEKVIETWILVKKHADKNPKILTNNNNKNNTSIMHIDIDSLFLIRVRTYKLSWILLLKSEIYPSLGPRSAASIVICCKWKQVKIFF